VECKQLERLIIEHGPAWSLIKRVDDDEANPKLSRRTQGNLKDKARQMAVDYYKAFEPIPKNFEYIRLQTVEKEKLKQMGISVLEPPDP